MPELPDVEGYRRSLAPHLPGRRIEDVTVLDAGVVRNTSAAGLARALVGRRFAEPDRHGKWLLLPTDGPTLLVHSGMTGTPYFSDGSDTDRFDRVVISLDGGQLRYRDLRKLRGLWLAHDDAEVAEVIGPQGPDALGLDRAGLRAALDGRRGALKAALMDQSVLAGLGNMLVDEILWQSGVHPGRSVTDLSDGEVTRLHRTLRRVLDVTVRRGHIPRLARWVSGQRGEDDPHCPRCGTALRRDTFAGRTTYWCPRCQPPP